MTACVIGVDVGGTNTDAVILSGNDVKGKAKVPTTKDVTTGVTNAVIAALKDHKAKNPGTLS